MVEKPKPEEAPSNLGIVGRYILTPEIFECLEQTQPGKGGEIQITDGLRLLLQRQAIYGYEFEGTRYDTGNKLGFLKASVEMALKRPDLGDEFRAVPEEPGFELTTAVLGQLTTRSSPRRPQSTQSRT